MIYLLSVEKPNLPRSQSDVGIFARLKSVCLSSSGSNKTDFQAKLGAGATADSHMSKSNTDLTKDDNLDEILNSEVTQSKSCSDLTYSFKDESDVDITGLLDTRFGKLGQAEGNGNS